MMQKYVVSMLPTYGVETRCHNMLGKPAVKVCYEHACLNFSAAKSCSTATQENFSFEGFY